MHVVFHCSLLIQYSLVFVEQWLQCWKKGISWKSSILFPVCNVVWCPIWIFHGHYSYFDPSSSIFIFMIQWSWLYYQTIQHILFESNHFHGLGLLNTRCVNEVLISCRSVGMTSLCKIVEHMFLFEMILFTGPEWIWREYNSVICENILLCEWIFGAWQAGLFTSLEFVQRWIICIVMKLNIEEKKNAVAEFLFNWVVLDCMISC